MAKIYGGRWEIIEPLGQGGQAHTFLARDLRGEGDAHYPPMRLIDTNRLDRFKREVETIRNLNHENILRLIDFELEDEKPYLVSEFCAGKSLRSEEHTSELHSHSFIS